MNQQYVKGDKVHILNNSRPESDPHYEVAEAMVGRLCTVKYDGGSEGVLVYTDDMNDWLWFAKSDIKPII